MTHAERSSYSLHSVATKPVAGQTRVRTTSRDFVLFAHPRRASAAILVSALVLGLLSAWLLDVPAVAWAAALPHGIRTVAGAITLLGLSNYMLVTSAIVVLGSMIVSRRDVSAAARRFAFRLRERAAFFFVAVAGSGIAAQIVKHIVGRARPKSLDTFGAFHFDLLSIKASLASFPSGHATSAFAAATALGVMLPRWRFPLFALACLISASRVLVGAHYGSDVVAGAALGLLFTIGLAAFFAGKGWTFEWKGSSLVLHGQDHGPEPSA